MGDYICENCFKRIDKLKIKRQYKEIFFAYNYEGEIRKLILQYKFNDKSYLYKTFAKLLLKNKKLCQFLKSYDIILSVPLHNKRLKERGYNQSQLIAEELVKEYNLHNKERAENQILNNEKECNNDKENHVYNKTKCSNEKDDSLKLIYFNDVIIKTKNIKPQSTKILKDRIQDVIGIYEIKNKEKIIGKNIIIFDDIYTTGSTLNECKKVLLEAGAKKVGMLALAKDYIE